MRICSSCHANALHVASFERTLPFPTIFVNVQLSTSMVPPPPAEMAGPLSPENNSFDIFKVALPLTENFPGQPQSPPVALIHRMDTLCAADIAMENGSPVTSAVRQSSKWPGSPECAQLRRSSTVPPHAEVQTLMLLNFPVKQ
jgi:hypothetical protein